MKGAGSSQEPVVVAIDGPSGVGKSTAAKALAERLELPYLDTGAMYRALGLKVLEAGIEPEDAPAVVALLETTSVDLVAEGSGALQVLLDGEPVGERIRTPRVSEVTSKISTYPEVRRRMVALQRHCGESTGGVVEGRDIGTRVFPGTPHKFFLEASPEVRLERRYQQLREKGSSVDRGELAADLERRDARDRGRADSPLSYDDSYTVVDASDLTAEEVVESLFDHVRTSVDTP